MNEKTSEELLEEMILKLIQDGEKCDLGSEEQERWSKCVERFYKLKIDEFRAKADWDIGVDRVEKDNKELEDEMARKKKQRYLDLLKIFVDMLRILVTCGTFAALTVASYIFESKGCILPKSLTKFADKIRIE